MFGEKMKRTISIVLILGMILSGNGFTTLAISVDGFVTKAELNADKKDDQSYYYQMSYEQQTYTVKTNVFGTISYYFPATVSADGMPTKLTARCRILECSDKITAKEDIKASEVDKDGNVINENVTVFEDSVVQPVYVDPEHYVDCLLEDGTVVRFEFTFEEDKVLVDGEDVNEIFDGLVYEDEE